MKKNINVLSIIIVVAVFIAGVITVYLPISSFHDLTVENVYFTQPSQSQLHTFDSTPQVKAHRVVLITLFLAICLAGFLLKIKYIKDLTLSSYQRNIWGYFVGGAIIVGGIYNLFLLGGAAKTQLLYMLVYVASYLFFLLGIKNLNNLTKKNNFFLILLAIAVCIITLALSNNILYFNDIAGFIFLNAHYDLAYSSTARLVHGLNLYEEITTSGFGIIVPILFSFFIRLGLSIDFLINLACLFYFTSALTILYLYNSKNTLFILFVIFCASILIYTGFSIRYLCFPISLIMIFLVRGNISGFVLGSVSAFSVLWNPETGVSIAFGCLVFLILRENKKVYTLILLFIKFVTGLTTTFLIFYSIFYIILGYLPNPPMGFLTYLIERSSGYGGIPLPFNTLMLVIFIHSLYTVTNNTLLWLSSETPLNIKRSFKSAVATMLLIWFAYYVNRPEITALKLSIYCFLYIFLIADIFNTRYLYVLQKEKISFKLIHVSIAIVCILMTYLTYLQTRELSSFIQENNIKKLIMNSPLQYNPIDGFTSRFYLPSELVTILNKKIVFIKNSVESETAFHFSLYGDFISYLSKNYQLLPYYNVYAEVMNELKYDKLAQQIELKKPELLLFDDFSSDEKQSLSKFHYANLMEGYGIFYDQVTKRMSHTYYLDKQKDGWIVWRRRH
ncbi:hypothetical protein [Beggiatoa leptomitoformis]|uniref:Uncharacterized protein n=1 Tax=Beggiatoa leptomitoformis TaxID=288004 RepID=A0A2N9YB68_9GAMM|nr:hypothetical protein [Beggiatoa leptomitoformis]ALG66919.1 hypothetical protein AL038_03305 [Beggiatoa leptomitoformis]AUI67715.1 hypothetical protein BLE401_02725 [Beggiatoa leptomitoformis]